MFYFLWLLICIIGGVVAIVRDNVAGGALSIIFGLIPLLNFFYALGVMVWLIVVSFRTKEPQ